MAHERPLEPPLLPGRAAFELLGPDGVLLRERLLAPYLTTRDLLRMSEVATWGKGYARQLASMTVCEMHQLFGGEGFVARAALAQTRLTELLFDGAVEPGLVMGVLIAGSGATVKTLRAINMEPEACSSLCKGLGARACPALESLTLKAEAHGVYILAMALAQGCCPELRSLRFDGGSFGRGGDQSAGRMMADMLSSGACPKLEALQFQECRLRGREAQPLFKGLEGREHRNLRSLVLQDCGLTSSSLLKLTQTIMSGALSSLEELNLSWNDFDDMVMVVLADAVAAGVCPRLRVLKLDGVVAPSHAPKLAAAMSVGKLQCLEELSMQDCDMQDEGVQALARAWAKGACPKLRRLDLMANGMGDEGCRALAEVR
jgi:hypothetical protein